MNIQLLLDYIEFIWWKQWVYSGSPEAWVTECVPIPKLAWVKRLGITKLGPPLEEDTVSPDGHGLVLTPPPRSMDLL